MADNGEASNQMLVFKVRTSADTTHNLTMPDSATVLDLKTILAGQDYENVPRERQRLIYSGRVLKNEDTLATYKIKPNNTIHMVKSAASNPAPAPSASTPAPVAIPSNMSAGTANNPLAALTGARYAGHINLPSREMFGADGGMGPPPSVERLTEMLQDPNMQRTVNAALDNPEFINFLIQSHPTLRNMPNARELVQSPFLRRMMTDPNMLRMATQMNRGMGGAAGAGANLFPAPGILDSPSPGAAASGETPSSNSSGGNHTGNNTATGAPQVPPFPPELWPLIFPPVPMSDQPDANNQGANSQGGTERSPGGASNPGSNNAAANPFVPFLNFGLPEHLRQGMPPSGSPQSSATQNPQNPAPPMNPILAALSQGYLPHTGNPELLQTLAQHVLGGSAQGQPLAQDNRPPEERYAEQLRQLNDMGFFDFDRNVAALRRSGGSVQGAIEYLLGS